MTSLRDALPATITTARLTLRAPMLADLDAMVGLANNPLVAMPTAALPIPYLEQHGRDFIENVSVSALNRPYAMIDARGAYIGTVGMHFIEGRLPELGYWLGQPFWGQGYASEAAIGLRDAAHATGLFPRINARVLADNPASVRVLEKAGFSVIEHTTSVVERHRGRPLLILSWSAPA